MQFKLTNYITSFWILVTNVILIAHFSNGIEVGKELTLTHKEKMSLDLLKQRLNNVKAETWMKSDLALIRWLRTKNLNVGAAEESFKANIRWREDNSIDSILDEDWSWFKSEYFFDEEGTDFEGRPVVAADISEWNVRDAVLSGKRDQLLRYMIRGIEVVSRRIRSLQEQGQNVTQWQVILNMDNFNLVQHGCFQCLPLYLQFISAHETYFPFGADNIVIIKTPAAFEVVLNLLRPVMSPAMRDSLTVVGTNRQEWRKVVLSIAPADQLPLHFGGTKASY